MTSDLCQVNRRRVITVFEWDWLVAQPAAGVGISGVPALAPEPTQELTRQGRWLHRIPAAVFDWLEQVCLQAGAHAQGTGLRLGQHRGQRALQIMGYAGVIGTPTGWLLEVLPKTGADAGTRAVADPHPLTPRSFARQAVDTRRTLLAMLRCLPDLQGLVFETGSLEAAEGDLSSLWISTFLQAVRQVLQHGPSGTYQRQRSTSPVLRGRWRIADTVRHPWPNSPRFVVEQAQWSTDRPEHRLIHAALLALHERQWPGEAAQALPALLRTWANIAPATPREQIAADWAQVQLGRDTAHCAPALAWARLILTHSVPVGVLGPLAAQALLLPMATVFEACVAQHLRRQLPTHLQLHTQVRTQHLVWHREQPRFGLRPDLLVLERRPGRAVARLLLDTKWKPLDSRRTSGARPYGLSATDLYQLQAYGHSYLDGQGDLVLIYPRTERFTEPLPPFDFPKSPGLRLWVLPFCVERMQLCLPPKAPWAVRWRQPGSAVSSPAHLASPT